MIRRRTITSYVWNSVSGNKMVILSNCIRNFFRKFELTGNSTQGENPAPDNPQEIKSAGRKSKNLFNIADLRVGQVQKDGTINEKQIYYRTVILDVPEDGKYRITFNSNDDYTMLYFTEAYANGAYSNPYIRVHAGNPNYYITLAKGKNILSFSTHTASGNIAFTTDHNIMIAAESETLDYEPYGYFFDLKITGKNLFDREKARDITNWIVRDGNGYAKFPIRVGKGNKVTFYYSEKLTTGKGFYVGIAQSETSAIVSWLYHSAETNLNNKKYTAVAAGDYIYLSCTISGIQKFVDTIQTLQVEIGSEQTEYEPYTEQTVQIALDEPLRGVGEYKDEIDFKRGKYVQRILKAKPKQPIVFKTRDPNGRCATFDQKLFDVEFKTADSPALSTIAKYSSWANGADGTFALTQLNGFYYKDSTKTLEEVNEIFTKLGTNFEICGVLETPIEHDLPQEVIEAYKQLQSENGTTHIFVDSGEVEAGINIEYKYKS